MAIRNLAFVLSLGFVFVVPWEGVIELPGLGTAAKLIGFATGGVWFVSVIVTNRFRRPGLFHALVCLFVMWNGLSLFWSGDPGTTMLQVRTWVQLLAMVFILWDLYTTRAAVLAGLQAFILGEYVAIGTAVSNFLSGNAFYDHYERFSPASQSNPDGFGFIVVLGIPVAWYLASSLSGTRLAFWLKLVNYAYIPAAFFGLALSGTRTALIASIVGMAFGLSTLTRLRLAARIPIFLLLAASILVLLPHVQSLRSFQRFSTTYEEITQGDLNNRTNNWFEGLSNVPDQPFLGVGAAMYRSVNSLGKVAHNSFISVLVELGLVGFVLFVTILMIAGLGVLRLPKWDARFWLTVLAVWAIGASSLTYEHRKATWLFLSLAIASAALTRRPDELVGFGQDEEAASPYFRQIEMKDVLQGG